MKSLTKENFESEALNAPIPVIVIFMAGGCKPCELMRSDLEEIEKAFAGKVSMRHVEVEGNEELADRCSVIQTPTIIMFAGGKQALQVIGYNTRRDLEDKIGKKLNEIS
ncbi:MAG TPA: thioredoxin family protein [bacterium]|nr:MAG: Thioredoxin [bacterium ADurb.Bin236]HOY62159.1 thioredoxin family protein [bacterium]HPI77332.1 thioredoxin family protein [bacterium]HPN95687.1 thioredoxin family protein [bacterium]